MKRRLESSRRGGSSSELRDAQTPRARHAVGDADMEPNARHGGLVAGAGICGAPIRLASTVVHVRAYK